METVKEAAKEYASNKTAVKAGYILNSYLAFEAGVEFAQRWIGVEETPPVGEN